MNERILLVEDDDSVREGTTLLLERAGLQVQGESNGRAGLEAFRIQAFDAVVLDVMMPEMDGLAVCRQIRATSTVPLLMLTAKADRTDIIIGLEMGADDYVTKPFDGAELVARVRALLRRNRVSESNSAVRVGDLALDINGHIATLSGTELVLSVTEFRLLHELASHPGQVLRREELLASVWNYDYMGDSRMVDMAVKRLRDKLGDDPNEPRYVHTVRGVGYRFRSD